MTEHDKDKTERSLTESIEWFINSVREEGPEIIQRLREGFEPAVSTVGLDLAAIIEHARRVKTDVQTYVTVANLLESEIKRGGIRIIAYSIGNRNFAFFLQEKEPYKITEAGYVAGTNIPLELSLIHI